MLVGCPEVDVVVAPVVPLEDQLAAQKGQQHRRTFLPLPTPAGVASIVYYADNANVTADDSIFAYKAVQTVRSDELWQVCRNQLKAGKIRQMAAELG